MKLRVPQHRSALNWLQTSLRNVIRSPRERFRVSADVVLELDFQKIRPSFRARQRGAENGARESPPTTAADLDEVERDIVTFFDAEQHRAAQDFEAHLTALDDEIVAQRGDGLLADIEARARAACAALRLLRHRGKSDLFALIRFAAAQALTVTEYRERHALGRDPQWPASRQVNLEVLVGVWLFNAAIGAAVLAAHNTFGIVGDALQAFLVAFVNVALGACAGWLALPFVTYRMRPERLRALFGLGLYLAVSLAWNVAVWRYGESLAAGGGASASLDAMRRLIDGALHFSSSAAWLFIGAGWICSFMAMIATWRIDDPYGRYGGIGRQALAARAAVADSRRRVIEEAQQLRDAALSDLQDLAESLELGRKRLPGLIQRQSQAAQRFRTYQSYLDGCGAILLSNYRTANEQARRTPPPPTFQREWKLERLRLSEGDRPSIDVPNLRSRLEAARASVMQEADAAIVDFNSVVESGGPPEPVSSPAIDPPTWRGLPDFNH